MKIDLASGCVLRDACGLQIFCQVAGRSRGYVEEWVLGGLQHSVPAGVETSVQAVGYYDGNPDEISGDSEGEFIGSILGGILRALTDDEYTIDYMRDGDVMRMKWYNDEYHTYIRWGDG